MTTCNSLYAGTQGYSWNKKFVGCTESAITSLKKIGQTLSDLDLNSLAKDSSGCVCAEVLLSLIQSLCGLEELKLMKIDLAC